MKAIVFHDVNDIRYEPAWPEPRSPRPGEVKIASSWCGICGTDMEDYKQGAVIPVGEPHLESGRMAPMVIGHEFSGRIAELGPGVDGLEVGQKVAVECVRVCYRCYWCKRGEYASCLNMVSIGQMDDGGMAEYFLAPAENGISIPYDMPEDVVARAEPLAVMVGGVRKGRGMAGDVVKRRDQIFRRICIQLHQVNAVVVVPVLYQGSLNVFYAIFCHAANYHISDTGKFHRR